MKKTMVKSEFPCSLGDDVWIVLRDREECPECKETKGFCCSCYGPGVIVAPGKKMVAPATVISFGLHQSETVTWKTIFVEYTLFGKKFETKLDLPTDPVFPSREAATASF
jgi:hypothetical protein